MAELPTLKIKVVGYANHIKISEDWFECVSIPEAYEKYRKVHPNADICYLGEIQGEITVRNKKIIKGKGEKHMSIKETTNTTQVTVDPKTTDAKGNIVPVGKKEESTQASLPIKETKVNDTKETKKIGTKAEVKPTAKLSKVSGKATANKSTKPAEKKAVVTKVTVVAKKPAVAKKSAVKATAKPTTKKVAKAPAKTAPKAKATTKTGKTAVKATRTPRTENPFEKGKARKFKVGVFFINSDYKSHDEAAKASVKLQDKGLKIRIKEVKGRFVLYTDKKS